MASHHLCRTFFASSVLILFCPDTAWRAAAAKDGCEPSNIEYSFFSFFSGLYRVNTAAISAQLRLSHSDYQVLAVDDFDLPSWANLRSFMECLLCTGTRATLQAVFELGQFPWPWTWATTAPPRLWLSVALLALITYVYILVGKRSCCVRYHRLYKPYWRYLGIRYNE